MSTDEGGREPRHLSRREALIAFGGLGAGALVLASRATGTAVGALEASARSEAAACILTPEQTEGPYYIDNVLFRRNITEGRPGTPLALRLTVVDASSCRPIRGAVAEVWHCDAAGEYSGFASGGTNARRFLRGQQRTDARGLARFTTIYPGWYSGRTTHIHCKVHVAGDEVHTGQLYFPEAVSSAVYRTAPYAARGQKDQPNRSDSLYRSGGARSLLRMSRGSAGAGYAGTITLGVRV